MVYSRLDEGKIVAIKTVADENIPLVREAFETLGDVATMAAGQMTPDALKDADLVAVRSVTRVDAALLAGARPRMVMTATVGFDHVDREYLTLRGIGFANAPGSNATSVSEYVMTALAVLVRRGLAKLEGASIGVIGVGNVGGRVARMAEALGMKPVLNDPPLERKTGDPKYRPLDEALACDVVTVHVPLSREGRDATFHMCDDEFFKRAKAGAVFLNTSRGAVLDSPALVRAVKAGCVRAAVLDVYEGEPTVDAKLVAHAAIATPHIAGHSYDGKVNGAEMIYRAACDFLGEEPTWTPHLPPPPVPIMSFLEPNDDDEMVRQACTAVYDIERDDIALREAVAREEAERAAVFSRLRREYPIRREFHNTTVILLKGRQSLETRLAGLGFKVRSRNE